MNIWQIAPPATVANSVAEFCLRHGITLLWPGDRGPWSPDRYSDDFALSDWVRWFAEDMKDGDAVLLRAGLSCIRAVGLITGEYAWEERFDDVHGFDLQHCRRVRWCRLPEEYDFGEAVFTRGRLSRVQQVSVRQYVSSFLNSAPMQWQTAPLPELPPEAPPLEEVPPALQSLVATASDLVSLFYDAQAFGEPPSEDELIVHFVIPFLRALGWSPERIAMKWRNVDVALFRALPRTPENCQVLIEAKRLGAGVEQALDQAVGYVRALGARADVLVTDGLRYRLYSSPPLEGSPSEIDPAQFKPVAYANLVRLKKPATELFLRLQRV
jgi:hypothetical protein